MVILLENDDMHGNPIAFTASHIWLSTPDLNAVRRFYLHELGGFHLAQDWGMGQQLLVATHAPQLGLMLIERADCTLEAGRSAHAADNANGLPRFSLTVPHLDAEFQRLSALRFTSGARFLSQAVFEFPAGRNITLCDPAGHHLVLEQAQHR